MDDNENHRVVVTDTQVESEYSGIYTRVEEITELTRQIGARKIGVAICSGLIEKSRILAKILGLNGFNAYGVTCKVGPKDKTSISLKGEYTKTEPITCDPILQAKRLNETGIELNIVVELYVGHGSLSYKHAEALTTTSITKGHVLGHNPTVTLY